MGMGIPFSNGNLVFMIILSEMKNPAATSQIIYAIILKNGRMTSFTGQDKMLHLLHLI